MSFYSPTYQFKAYQNFKTIDSGSYRTIVRFYEDYEKEITALDFELYFEILVAYVNALFEIGDYERHLAYVDHVIEASIQYNIRYFEGLNIYENMLFKKAASQYHLGQYREAEYILRELIKIDPSEKLYGMFLKRCLRKRKPVFLTYTRAASVLIFLCSACMIGLELLVVRHFFPEYEATATFTRNVLFLSGWVILLGGDSFHLLHTHERVKRYVSSSAKLNTSRRAK